MGDSIYGETGTCSKSLLLQASYRWLLWDDRGVWREDMSYDLEAALRRLEDVLDGVQANLDHYCGMCYTEADAVALAGPVERIPDQLVVSVSMEVPDHFDDFANLYRKITPRAMALLVHDQLNVDADLIAERLTDTGCWESWADDERDAVLAVCEAWWPTVLADHPSRPPAYEVLGFLAMTPVPFVHWLDIWNSQPAGPADQHAVDICRHWAAELPGGVKLGWNRGADVTAELAPWILNDARPRVTRAGADQDLIEVLDLVQAIMHE